MNIIFVEKTNISHTVFKTECSLNYFHSDLIEKKRNQFRIKSLSSLRI